MGFQNVLQTCLFELGFRHKGPSGMLTWRLAQKSQSCFEGLLISSLSLPVIAQRYLQLHYCNGVFGWTTLGNKHCRHPIAVMGVLDMFRHSARQFPTHLSFFVSLMDFEFILTDFTWIRLYGHTIPLCSNLLWVCRSVVINNERGKDSSVCWSQFSTITTHLKTFPTLHFL